MKFEQLWDKLQKERQVRLETGSRKQGFAVNYDGEYNDVVVTPESTQIPRRITRKDFQKVWEKFKEINGDPYRPAFYQRVTLNASYILAIMNYFLKGGKVE